MWVWYWLCGVCDCYMDDLMYLYVMVDLNNLFWIKNGFFLGLFVGLYRKVGDVMKRFCVWVLNEYEWLILFDCFCLIFMFMCVGVDFFLCWYVVEIV